MLEPYAISELLFYFAFTSLNALALLEGRSYLSGRLGEKLFDESFTVWDEGLDPRNYPKSFDLEGVPKKGAHGSRTESPGTWSGTAAPRSRPGRPRLDRPRARAARPGLRADPVQPLDGRRDAASVDELAKLVGDGIYVTRLHYLGVVDPREGIITGMTRDGTFRIEGGKVTRPSSTSASRRPFPRSRPVFSASRTTSP